MEKYWYLKIATECPVCGKGNVEKLRVYGEKPERWEDRNQFKSTYDHCMEEVYYCNSTWPRMRG